MLREDFVCDIALPRLPKRTALEAQGFLNGPRCSALEEDLAEMEAQEEGLAEGGLAEEGLTEEDEKDEEAEDGEVAEGGVPGVPEENADAKVLFEDMRTWYTTPSPSEKLKEIRERHTNQSG